jgi:hypothetical protein
MTGADEIVIDEHIQVRRFVLNDLLTNGFVVQATDTGSLVIIDPGDRAGDLIAAAEACPVDPGDPSARRPLGRVG